MNSDPRQIASELMGQLERAWNRADGAAFGAPFTEDADFVDIRGDYHRTQAAIGQGHQHIIDTIYKDSVIQYELMQARMLADKVMIAHIKGTMNAPIGPLAGEHSSVMTVVIVETTTGWRIAAFHNTLQTG